MCGLPQMHLCKVTLEHGLPSAQLVQLLEEALLPQGLGDGYFVCPPNDSAIFNMDSDM